MAPLVAAGVALLAMTVGCAAHPAASPGGCTLIGGESGVTFELPVAVGAAVPVRVRACVQNICETFRLTARGAPFVTVEDSRLYDARPVTVRLLLRDAHDSVLFKGARQVTPQRFTPNGPRCDNPPWWRADVSTAGRTHLVALDIHVRTSLPPDE